MNKLTTLVCLAFFAFALSGCGKKGGQCAPGQVVDQNGQCVSQQGDYTIALAGDWAGTAPVAVDSSDPENNHHPGHHMLVNAGDCVSVGAGYFPSLTVSSEGQQLNAQVLTAGHYVVSKDNAVEPTDTPAQNCIGLIAPPQVGGGLQFQQAPAATDQGGAPQDGGAATPPANPPAGG